LLWALQTCVAQDYDALEIIVSDNHSTDATRDVVHSFKDKRVRYLNTGKRVSMSENWEFALSHVTEGYVGFIGDDDGLMPGAAAALAGILNESRPTALTWPVHSYYWPTFVDPALSNCLSMSLRQPLDLTERDSQKTLQNVASFQDHCHALPSLYWGVVDAAVVQAVRRRTGGVFFRSITPDIYSGVAIAGCTKSYLSTSRMFTLSGSSSHSTGANQVTGVGAAGRSTPSARFTTENTIQFCEELDYAPSIPILTAEAVMQFRGHANDTRPHMDVMRMFDAALKHPEFLFNPLVRSQVTVPLRETAAKHDLLDHLDRRLTHQERLGTVLMAKEAAKNLLLGRPIFQCDPTVTNIYEATLEADRLLAECEGRARRLLVGASGRARKIGRVVRSARGRFARR
jgi:hypothetical protein